MVAQERTIHRNKQIDVRSGCPKSKLEFSHAYVELGWSDYTTYKLQVANRLDRRHGQTTSAWVFAMGAMPS
jgi:hypothetical protein